MLASKTLLRKYLSNLLRKEVNPLYFLSTLRPALLGLDNSQKLYSNFPHHVPLSFACRNAGLENRLSVSL